MKKRMVIIAAIVLALILLFPIPLRYRDGGTIEYRSIVNLYSITKLHELRPIEEGGGFNVGTEVRIFGVTVYRNLRVEI